MADILGSLMRRAEDSDLVKGFEIGSNVSVSHLQFVDDTNLFCEVRGDYIDNLRAILKCFERIFGLMVNMEKCTVAGLNLGEGELPTYAQLLGCQQESWPL